MEDEELLNALLAGRLDAADAANVVRRLRAERGLREHLLDMLAVRAMLPVVIDSTALPTDEACAAARATFPARLRAGLRDAGADEHLGSCASCAVAFEIFALTEGDGAARGALRATPVRRRLLAAASVLVLAGVVATATFRFGGADTGGGGAAAARDGDVSASGGAPQGSLRLVGDLPPSAVRTPQQASAEIAAALAPLRDSAEAAEFVAAVDALIAAIAANDPQRDRLYGRFFSMDYLCPESIMWATAALEPDPRLRGFAYSMRQRGTSVSAAEVRAAILRERAAGIVDHDASLFARLPRAHGEVDRSLIAFELAAIRDDDFAADPARSERRLQNVVVAAFTFASDPAVLGMIEDVAVNAAHPRSRAAAILQLTGRRAAVGDAEGVVRYLERALPYLSDRDDGARVFAELAFERHADPEWLAKTAARLADEGRADLAAALRKAAVVRAANESRPNAEDKR